jgi:micrococcal nuclease
MATKPKEDYVRNAEVIRIIDGDTVELRVDLGCDIDINMTCRLAGINAPEKATAAGKQAKAWMEAQLPPGRAVVVKTTKGDEKEKYGRYLATLYLPNTATSINTQLVSVGHAVAYDGGKR